MSDEAEDALSGKADVEVPVRAQQDVHARAAEIANLRQSCKECLASSSTSRLTQERRELGLLDQNETQRHLQQRHLLSGVAVVEWNRAEEHVVVCWTNSRTAQAPLIVEHRRRMIIRSVGASVVESLSKSAEELAAGTPLLRGELTHSSTIFSLSKPAFSCSASRSSDWSSSASIAEGIDSITHVVNAQLRDLDLGGGAVRCTCRCRRSRS